MKKKMVMLGGKMGGTKKVRGYTGDVNVIFVIVNIEKLNSINLHTASQCKTTAPSRKIRYF